MAIKSLFSKLYKDSKVSGRRSSSAQLISEADPSVIRDQFSALTQPDLKECCKSRKLPVGGVKSVLLERLRAFESGLKASPSSDETLLPAALRQQDAAEDEEQRDAETNDDDEDTDYLRSLEDLAEDDGNQIADSSTLSGKRTQADSSFADDDDEDSS